jgi:hypothetical protein
MTLSKTADDTTENASLSPTQAWSSRVRRIGGFIQVAFAAFWLVRGSLNIPAGVGVVVAAGFGITVVAVTVYGFRSAQAAPRPTGAEARRIERAVTMGTVIQLVASFGAPAVVIVAGHPDWVLPSIAITIGPLLLWLDHRLDIPRYRPVGWALILGPMVLAASMSGAALAATTGIAAGLLLLGSAAAGFRDLASRRPLGVVPVPVPV